MNRSYLFLLAWIFFFCSGCLQVFEEVKINKDGSGTYEIRYDMSELFSDPMMKGIFEESLKQDKNLQDAGVNDLETDTTMYFRDNPEFSHLKSNKVLWDSGKVGMKISQKEEKVIMAISFDFNKVEDINQFYALMGEQQAGSSQDMLGGAGFLNKGIDLRFSKKKLTRLPMVNTSPKDVQENLEMMKMMLAMANYSTTYHLPGKVKKTDMPNAKIEVNKVTVVTPLIDILEGKAKMEGEIRFKNK